MYVHGGAPYHHDACFKLKQACFTLGSWRESHNLVDCGIVMFSVSSRRGVSLAKTRWVRWKSSSPVDPYIFIPSNPSPRTLIWPGIFTVAFTGGCFGLVSIARYHEHQGHKHRMIESAPARARDAWKTVERTNPSLLLLGPLIATNLGVFGCWKAFPDSTTMLKYFLQVPGQGRVLPLILSSFSHLGIVHLIANMVGLYSFGTAVSNVFGPSQTAAIYFSGSVIANFVNESFAVLSKRPILPSVGASGGIFALLSIHTCLYPDSQMYLIFFPFFSFAAKHGLAALMLFDTVGLLRSWQVIGHAAHLGGATFGIALLHFEGAKYLIGLQNETYWWYHNLLQEGNAPKKGE